MVKEKLSLSYDSRTSEYVAVHMRMDLVAFRSCVNSHRVVTGATTKSKLKCKEYFYFIDPLMTLGRDPWERGLC